MKPLRSILSHPDISGFTVFQRTVVYVSVNLQACILFTILPAPPPIPIIEITGLDSFGKTNGNSKLLSSIYTFLYYIIHNKHPSS